MHNRLRAVKSEEGFSLVELLIVIVVLGVLSGIVVFGVGSFKGDSEVAACNADKKAHAVAVQAWKAKNGPTSNPSVSDLTGAGYLQSAPKAGCTA